MVRAVDCAIRLTGYRWSSLLDQYYPPHFPYLSFVARRQAGSVQPRIDTNTHE